MKKWTGGTLIAALAVLLLLRYSLFETTTSPTTTTANHHHAASGATSLSSISFWNHQNKPHLIPNLEGLADLYSPPTANLSAEISRATLVWARMRGLLSRSDALPDTKNGVREAAVAWRELLAVVSEAEKDARGDSGAEQRHCPFSVTAAAVANGTGGWTLEVPCGFVQDSSVTVVGTPRGGNESSGFEIELVGSQLPGEDEQPPVVLRYCVALGGGKVGGEGAFIGQNAWTVKLGWGEEELCPAQGSKRETRVDGLPRCNEQGGGTKTKENSDSGQTDSHQPFNRSIRSAHLSINFPFIEEQLFTATLWAGLEGFHMTVNGRHETSFAYRERLEPWLVSEVKVQGDLELLSSMVNGLPVTGDSDMVVNVQNLRAPPVSKKRLFLLVGVFSTANNFERRMALRRSWMQYGAVRSGDVAVRFFTGLHKSSQVNLELWREAQTYDDIQLMPFVDYYSLISLKTIGICMFGTKILPAKYIMKTDDDAFVRIDEVLSSLKKSDSNGILYGLISFESAPHRDKESKWYISPEEWPNDSYPPWAHGPGYIVSRDIAKFIVRGHQERNLQLFKLEDVAMGIWIQQLKESGQQVHYINDDRFYSSNCEDGFVLAHYQGPRLILCLWDKLQREQEPICCE